MTKYHVQMPFTGYIDLEVEIDDSGKDKKTIKRAAIDAAWEQMDQDDFNWVDAIGEMQYHESTGEGNVTHVVLDQVSVQKAK